MPRSRLAAGAAVLFASSVAVAQTAPPRLPADRMEGPPQAEVLILGSYHMGNPGRDVVNLVADDARAPKRQAEIREVVDALARFHPTKIGLEANSRAPKVKQYLDYLAGSYELGPDERDQIGFRLAKELGLPKVYGIDVQEDYSYMVVQDYVKAHGRDKEFESLAGNSAAWVRENDQFLKSHSVLQMLLRLNSDDAIRRDRSFYALMAHFGEEWDYAGGQLLGDWYRRNVRIHTHLLNILEPGDRALVIYGAGHLRILREFVEADPTLKLRTLEEFAAPAK